MLTDAHIHLVDLEERDPGFVDRLAAAPVGLCAASHDGPEWERSLAIIGRIRELRGAAGGEIPLLSSFGIHPQWAVWKNADLLAGLAAAGRIAAIGEAGFDFYGDRPERVRNPENEAAQRAVFEFQLGLARRHGLPILLHARRAMDLVFSHTRELAALPAVILHSYSGTAREGADLLGRRVNAYFSFGTVVLNGHKRAIEACASLPSGRILAETDAPWQPPKGADYCRFEDLDAVTARIAELRGLSREAAEDLLAANFRAAFGRGRGIW